MPKTTKIQVKIDMPEIVDAVIKQLSYDGTLVAVVRCKECVHHDGKDGQCPVQSTADPFYDYKPDDNWYCGDGDDGGDR